LTPETDEALLEAVRRDDPAAFERFVARYGRRIYGFGLRVCGEPEDAKDVAQDTLLQAFRSLKGVAEAKALKTWLYRVASNACRMKRRRGKFEPERELSLDELMPRLDDAGPGDLVPDFRPLPDESASREELRASLRAAVDALPPHYRIVLVLRDMEELDTREVAEALELPESTVKMRLHRARLQVRKTLEERLGA
jgi:RNA polymerase sigma-70 factor (ECF subfamily)